MIELAVLQAIEKEFRDELKIQWFFDLVVGTRQVYHIFHHWGVLTAI